MAWTIYFDGSCSKPGGSAAYGFILYHNEEEVSSGHSIIGDGPGMTNNLAEHRALTEGLKSFIQYKNPYTKKLYIYGDSMLVVNQINGKWGSRGNKPYKKQYKENLQLITQIKQMGVKIYCEWIPREKNQKCDDLSKKHLTTTLKYYIIF